MSNKEMPNKFERARAKIERARMAFDEKQSRERFDVEKQRNEKISQEKLDRERLDKFRQYQPRIYSFLNEVNKEVFNNRAKVEGWKQTKSKGLDYHDFDGSTITDNTDSEQIETILTFQNNGSVRVALPLTYHNDNNDHWKYGSFIVDRSYYRPESLVVKRSSNPAKETLLESHRGTEVSLDLEKDEFFELLEAEILSESVELAKTPYKK